MPLIVADGYLTSIGVWCRAFAQYLNWKCSQSAVTSESEAVTKTNGLFVYGGLCPLTTGGLIRVRPEKTQHVPFFSSSGTRPSPWPVMSRRSAPRHAFP